MPKAIILTGAPVKMREHSLLKNTNIFKVAINQHAEDLKPDIRICTDWNLQYLLNSFPENVISLRDKSRCKSPRVIYPDIEYKGATIIAAVEYLINQGYTDILIVGDNTVNIKAFQENIKKHIGQLAKLTRIYCYTKGNFNLPCKKITEFLKQGAQ